MFPYGIRSGVPAVGFGWAGIDAHRLYVHAPLAVPLRPTLGIQLAPAVVGCSAYLSMTHGAPDFVAKGLMGYGLLQGLILLRLLPWIMEQPFQTAALRLIEAGAGGGPHSRRNRSYCYSIR